MCELVAQGKLMPVIDEELPLDQVASAHRRLGSRQNVGKVVLTVDRST